MPSCTGDGHGGVAVVARNHHRADARLAAFGDGGLHLGTDGIDHARQAQDRYRLLLQGFRARCRAGAGAIRAGAGQSTRRAWSAIALFVGQDLPTQRRRQRSVLARRLPEPGCSASALRPARPWCTECSSLSAVLCTVRHHFAHAESKGASPNAGLVCASVSGFCKPSVRGPVYQRAFGGLAHGRARCHPGLASLHSAMASGQRVCASAAAVLHHGHFVLGQRARFIRANHLCAAQRFHSRQACG